MENIQHLLSQAPREFHKFALFLEQTFLQWTENIDFAFFCIIYTVFLVIFLRYVTRTEKFRPKNKELVSWKQSMKDAFMSWVFTLPIIKGKVMGKKQKNFEKADEQVFKDLDAKRDSRRSFKLPATGMNDENLKRRIEEWYSKQVKKMETGKISGALYIVDQEYYDELNSFASKYMYHNPLHLDTFKELMKMEAEVLKMTASLISKNPEENAFGVITSGGSQSLIMMLYAYRKFYSNRTKPNIVVPNTIHAAVDKGCFYFNIEVRKARLDSNYAVDLKHLESMIDSNTILIMGSYPNYPHGIIDPVTQLAKIGLKHSVGVHIDGCLGGFVAAFDAEHQKVLNIDTKGITSISLDHHKFGLAPKGISTVFFKTRELRHCMYYVNSEWCGGIYGTPSFCGSRNGFASAGAWYALTRNTKKTYKINTQTIIEATKKTAESLKKIPGIKVFGDPKLCALGFTSETVSCLDLSSYLNKEKGYDISPIHLPNGIHISMTLANCEKMQIELAKDIIQGFEYLKKQPAKSSAVAAIYGASSTIPTADMGDEFLKVIMGATLK